MIATNRIQKNLYVYLLRKFYGASGKTQLMDRSVACKPGKQLVYKTMLERCQIMFGTRRDRVRSSNASIAAKDCLVLPQYDVHHDGFLLVTSIVMSSYKSIASIANRNIGQFCLK